jgi:polyisoprenoid-binding protein YceI
MTRFGLHTVAGIAMVGLASATPAAAGFTADPVQSRLGFTGTQSGAPFKAVFHKFTAAVDFSPDALAAAHFDVVIELKSVDSQDGDRDKTIRGPDIFDADHFPTAHYVTKAFTKTATGYAATGALTLRGVTKDVPIDFQFTTTAAGAKLDGSAKLNRLEFGAGQGDWKSTQWVGDAVKVEFSLVLTPKH